MEHERHNRPGHLNVCVLDQDDVVTGFGKHARVVASHPDHEGLYVRIDRPAKVRASGDFQYPNLPDPTDREILTVARKDQGLRGRWKIRSREEWNDGNSIDCYFDHA